ncbi:MAG: putative signal transducing protein [Rubripirellula sp.]
MTDEKHNLDDTKLVTVAECYSESSATILVSVLQDAGIRAVATGGFTAGFRAEAPGLVRVRTLEFDAERAKQVIAEVKPLEESDTKDDSEGP